MPTNTTCKIHGEVPANNKGKCPFCGLPTDTSNPHSLSSEIPEGYEVKNANTSKLNHFHCCDKCIMSSSIGSENATTVISSCRNVNCECHKTNISESWEERFDKEFTSFWNEPAEPTRWAEEKAQRKWTKDFIKSELETATSAAIERTVREILKMEREIELENKWYCNAVPKQDIEDYAQSKGINLAE